MTKFKPLIIALCLAGPIASCLIMSWLVFMSWSNPQGNVWIAFNMYGERLSETIAMPLWGVGGLIAGIILLIKRRECRK